MKVSDSYSSQGPATSGYLFMLPGFCIIGYIIFFFLVSPILRLFPLSHIHLVLLTQCVTGILLFWMPAWITEFYYRRKTYEHIYRWRTPKVRGRDGIVALLLVVLSVPVTGMLLWLMEQVPAPMAWLRDLEVQMQAQTMQMLDADDPISVILLFLAVVVVAPIGEEFLFRGALMGWGISRSGRVHLTVWLVAIFFSLIHLEWSGFGGRIFLGAILGYCAVYGGLKLSIIVHALNNLSALLLYKCTGDLNPGAEQTVLLAVLAVIALGGIIYILKDMSKHVNTSPISIETHE